MHTRKFEANAECWILIGYEADGKILLLLDPNSGKIIRRGNIKVDESNLMKCLRNVPTATESEDRQDFFNIVPSKSSSKNNQQNSSPNIETEQPSQKAPQDIDGNISDSNVQTNKRPKAPIDYSVYQISENEKIQTPKSYKSAMTSNQSKKWKLAQNQELKNLQDQNTWEIIPRHPGILPLRTMWVYAYKHDIETKQNKFKARLVVLGNKQTFNLNYTETFSPTPCLSTIRLVIALAASHKWQLYSLDISFAFVQAPLNETIHVIPPTGLNIAPNSVLKLNKALYGLKQAGRAWYLHLQSILCSYGLKTCTFDPCLFYQTTAYHTLIILVYVDDIMITGSSVDLITNFRSFLSSKLVLKDFGKCTEYLNIHINQSQKGIEL